MIHFSSSFLHSPFTLKPTLIAPKVEPPTYDCFTVSRASHFGHPYSLNSGFTILGYCCTLSCYLLMSNLLKPVIVSSHAFSYFAGVVSLLKHIIILALSSSISGFSLFFLPDAKQSFSVVCPTGSPELRYLILFVLLLIFRFDGTRNTFFARKLSDHMY